MHLRTLASAGALCRAGRAVALLGHGAGVSLFSCSASVADRRSACSGTVTQPRRRRRRAAIVTPRCAPLPLVNSAGGLCPDTSHNTTFLPASSPPHAINGIHAPHPHCSPLMRRCSSRSAPLSLLRRYRHARAAARPAHSDTTGTERDRPDQLDQRRSLSQAAVPSPVVSLHTGSDLRAKCVVFCCRVPQYDVK